MEVKIEKVIGREIFDSRGYPTIECELILHGGFRVCASIPSGLSKSQYAAINVRDEKRFFGYGVSGAIETLEREIAPLLLGKEPDVIGTDLLLIDLDGTEHKSRLGANTMLAASIAVCKAQALATGFEIYDFIAYLCEYNTVSVPFPMFNIINGGLHADTSFPLQELLVLPMGKQTFREALEATILLSFEMRRLLKENGMPIIIGDEGGFVGDFTSIEQALDFVMEAINKTENQFVFGLDVAATQLYNSENNTYHMFGKKLASGELINFYEKLVTNYPIASLEDGLADSDWKGWQELTQRLGSKIQIVGDDIFATRAERIAQAVNDKIATATVIKPNQVGTVTETLQAVKFCKEHDIGVIASHRSGETNDPFIADLAVGVSASYIKAGGCARGERLAKYNHLLRIEDSLLLSLLDDMQE
jgi:enolase